MYYNAHVHVYVLAHSSTPLYWVLSLTQLGCKNVIDGFCIVCLSESSPPSGHLRFQRSDLDAFRSRILCESNTKSVDSASERSSCKYILCAFGPQTLCCAS